MAFTNTLNPLNQNQEVLCIEKKDTNTLEENTAQNTEKITNPVKKPKKKKKKRKYKSVRSIMKDIMKPKSRKETQEIHKEKILKTMGGGSFSKIDKI